MPQTIDLYRTGSPNFFIRRPHKLLHNSARVGHRRGFTIRLNRLKPRDPDFGGPQNFGSKDNFQQFCCMFVLDQRTYFYYIPLTKDFYRLA